MKRTEAKKYLTGTNPRCYHVQQHIGCCANCAFGGYLGDAVDPERMCICEIMGECENSDYAAIAVEPLAVCDAYKPCLTTRFATEEE